MIKTILKKIINYSLKNKMIQKLFEGIYAYSHLKEEGNHLIAFKDIKPLDQRSMQGFNNRNAILFVTFEKSGTYWLRNLLGNYIHKYVEKDKKASMSLVDIKTSYIKNWRHSYGNNKYIEPFDFKSYFTFEDILFQHILTYDCDIHFFQGEKFFVVRNPLDMLVSMYYFWDISKKQSIDKYIDYFITRFSKSYFYLNTIVKQNPESASWIHFEELKRNTELVFTKTLDTMGIPVDKDIVEYAIEQSSVKNIIKQEEAGVSFAKKDSSHIRSNQIGEWKSHLKPKHVKKITTMLQEYNIELTDFIIE